MLNKTNLTLLRDEIRAHPDEHDQSTWICGTTACAGGRAAMLAGWEPVYTEIIPTAAWRVINPADPHGAPQKIARVAQEWLGLDDYTASRLFFQTRATTTGVLAFLDRLIDESS